MGYFMEEWILGLKLKKRAVSVVLKYRKECNEKNAKHM